jgi:hypothetical protein
MRFNKIVVTAALSLICAAVMAKQDTTVDFYRHEIGVDVSNFFTLIISKKSESKLLNYKYHFNRKNTLRSGLNVNWSNDKIEGYKMIALSLGYERNISISKNGKWQFSFGADANFTYHVRNYMPQYYMRCGISPLVGVRYYVSPHLSLSTGAGVNFFYTLYRNPEMNLPEDNKNVFEINVGYVGMFLVSYHF